MRDIVGSDSCETHKLIEGDHGYGYKMEEEEMM